ncbi:TetR/AcrR family transcriptional regulator [Tunicatimonas pelagia]|uniref:TetR/AcrR family transcriptional regulator n=1 Tax=Tunicatimonas pelagia TaxID=931531 RepID=UPI002666909C|nr:TetR/AcrR family transcriptional regulator [Tunicatimonas pelagia]WKN43532.1 TetR/AcrR family transcriptional regulator [Tunicatimonas pelagia]
MARPRNFNENQVLDRAIDVFWEKGYHATSYEDLVNRMGINRASMYNTFGDKHQLYIQALQRYREKSRQQFDRWRESESSIQETIQMILNEAVHECVSDSQRKGCMVVNSATELGPSNTEIAEIIRENQQQVESVLSELFTRAQQRGEIAADLKPEALARFYFNTFSGLRVMGRANPDATVYRDVVDVALRVIE